MTECNREGFGRKGFTGREPVARLDGGAITSDAGVVLLGEVEGRRRILERFASYFQDFCDAAQLEHSVFELVSRRVLGLRASIGPTVGSL